VQFEIRHNTTYRYDTPVRLGAHIVRLTPRSDGNQRLQDYHCTVTPEPALQTNVLDAEGNQVTRLWFIGTTAELRIASAARVVTLRDNSSDYIVDTPATSVPVSYDRNEIPLLAAYRDPGIDAPGVIELAASLARQTEHNTPVFLDTLNGFLHTGFEREIRDQGSPQRPELTLAHRRGACRDLAMLFIAICHAQGIAARFVSGYQAHAETRRKHRYLHAWPEVYIPGGGWRGYDPTHGTAVADAHVALAASCRAAGTMPIEGSFYGDGAHSEMSFELSIHTND